MTTEPCLVTTNTRDSRKIYSKAFGPIPTTLHVLHRCDNPRCRQLSHLFLGTRSDNMRDMVAKGRQMPREAHPRGERHGRAKLTQEQVHLIRTQAGQGVLHTTLAQDFGVSPSLVDKIVANHVWKDAP